MSQRAREFVDRWVESNIHAEPYVAEQADPRPAEFARNCMYEARGSGISRPEIEQECGNLISYMGRALDAYASQEGVPPAAKED